MNDASHSIATLHATTAPYLVGVDPAHAMATSPKARGVIAPIIVGDARCLPC